MKKNLSLEQIEQAIANADPEQQKRLLKDLPHLLKLPILDTALLKAAEPSFEFWNNSEDIVYDQM